MKLNSLEDTFNLSKKIGKLLSNGDMIFLYGEIGVGKTTFVRGLINNLEVEKGIDESQILSPTFNIVFDYKIKNLTIMHYDLYRLKNSKDVNELGIFAEINDHITLIEWPELIEKKPDSRIEIFFGYLDEDFEKRNLKIKGYGKWSNYDFKKI
ncbi:MAG: tRNA (adenosine(37)-N6)-threonylcarbamoyltransferase complex ATPase subunit type 1 TsaE [Pelagibacteraceae bacterium]|jgi:tRNA threonylcarbamoyl adenosine modification protein YjeE|nr:tRNA (adenosine(37)-N6)-threonylcarbamoyltransferase complex ATPase subunit type 1 TsaE [Pelagibacteraceae bacterium]|tara:strand:+ start:4141 stop:4599 length:459 start_codon:yes stop_codon:yes gene_type:complete